MLIVGYPYVQNASGNHQNVKIKSTKNNHSMEITNYYLTKFTQ